jgi:hypothetical protein
VDHRTSPGLRTRLRCHVRECLVVWRQREHPAALPKVRNQGAAGFEAARRPTAVDGNAPQPGLITGSAEARERSRAFTGPSDEEPAERAQPAETVGAER